jgi:trehalose-phosphatase
VKDLARRLARLARTPVLLVATDYDGTLAPIVADPEAARPLRESVVALRMLAALPNTHVAVVSGRALRDLARVMGEPEDVHLVGSHGSEFDPDFAQSLPGEALALRDRVFSELTGIAGAVPGARVEPKPASIAFHYREVSEPAAQAGIRAILEGPGSLEGVFTKHGKKVVELGVLSTHKGTALSLLRQRVGASAVCFVGDDVTDEDAFATLGGPDLGVKVGDGETQAPLHVSDPEAVARLFANLAELRAAWLAGAEAVPIEEHACLSDQRTAALVTPGGRIPWLCLPRLDSPAIFGELLGGPTAGHFSVSDAAASDPVRQLWVGDSLVLETRWPQFRVVDFLDVSGGRPQLRPGRSDLVRRIEGRGRARIEFAPRLDFGRIPTRLRIIDGGLEVEPSPDPIVLRAPGVTWSIVEEGAHQSAFADCDLAAGPIELELRYGTGSVQATNPTAADRERLTRLYWSSWAANLVTPKATAAIVRRSALVLKALCHGPTGAIAAAATTSLPEHPGGVRNWDYRYCWLRDAALAAASLVRLGSTGEAMQFLGWMLGVVDRTAAPERLQPLYGLGGEPLGSEAEIGELSGYRGSRPVRVGNLAAHQVQLDVFGPIVDLVSLLSDRDAPLSSEHWRLVEGMVGAVAARWHEPDHGIWGIRRAPRHHVHSKLMCWLAADRGVRIAERLLGRARPEWGALRDRIAADVLERGWKRDIAAFSAAYDGHDLDAAVLAVGLSGLLEADDPRWASTVAAVERGLHEQGTVYRYRADDGLPGAEGGFHLCTGWLLQAYLTLGRRDDAQALFETLRDGAGPTGMLSEQISPATGLALGNTPQAYSHLALIDAALALAAADGTDIR